jgi:dTDP-4-dehydrorhamnose reductase
MVLGDGLLSTEICKQTDWPYISRKKDIFDFDHIQSYWKYLYADQVLNCIGNTDTYSSDREKHWKTNYKSVIDLVDFCNHTGKKLIHISTDFVYAGSVTNASENDIPVHAKTWYSYCKLLADGYVQARAKNYLLIRTSFKPKPFPYRKAFGSLIGNFDYTDVIASMIVKLIEAGKTGVWNVGSETKTMYDLAFQTNENVELSYDYPHADSPTDVSMDVKKLNDFLGGR